MGTRSSREWGPVEKGEAFGREERIHRAALHAALVQKVHVGGEAKGGRRIVESEDDPPAVVGEGTELAVDPCLVAEVKRGGGFVEDEDTRILGKESGERDPSPFPRGKGGVRAAAKRVEPDAAERAGGVEEIRGRFAARERQVRVAALEHEFPGAEGKSRGFLRSEVAQKAGGAARTEVSERVTGQENFTARRRMESGEGAQKRRFPGPVDSENGPDLARRKTPGGEDGERALALGDAEIADREKGRAHGVQAVSRSERRRRKRGTPRRAVTTPIGSSRGARTLWARVSAERRRLPPRRVESGSTRR